MIFISFRLRFAYEYYREGSKSMTENMESTIVSGAVSSVCPWDEETFENPSVSVSICPWEDEEGPSTSKKATRYVFNYCSRIFQ